jgi:hypothetical protein
MLLDDLKGNKYDSVNRLVMAINSGQHWQLVVCWVPRKTLMFLDPLGESGEAIENAIEKWK